MISEDELLYDKTHGVFSFLNNPEIQRRLAPILIEIVDNVLAVVSQICPAIEPIRNLVQMFKPDLKHEEIMNKFEDLQFRLEDLKYDRLRAQREDAWQHAKTRIMRSARVIENSARVVRILRDGVPESSLDEWLDELAQACQQINAALMHVFKAVSPAELDTPLNENIFQCYYEYVGGDHRLVQNMVSTVLQLLANGLTAYCVYEAHRHDVDFVTELFRRYRFKERFTDATNSGGQALTKCLTEYPRHMADDVKNVFYRNRSTSPTTKLTELAEMFYKKYYWLETFCLLYLPAKEKYKNEVDFEAGEVGEAVSIDVVDAPVVCCVAAENASFITDINACDTSPSDNEEFSRNKETAANDELDELDRPTGRKQRKMSKDIDDRAVTTDMKFLKRVDQDNIDGSNLAEISRSKCIVFSRKHRKSSDPDTGGSNAAIQTKVRRIVDDNVSLFTNVTKAKCDISEALRRQKVDVWGVAVFKVKNAFGFECATVCRTSLSEIEKLVWVEKDKVVVCVLLN